MGKNKPEDWPKTITGKILAGAVALPGGIVGGHVAAVSGAVRKMKGGRFEDGVKRVVDPIERMTVKAGKLGDKHNKKVMRALLIAAARHLGTEIGDSLGDKN